MDTNDYVEDRP